MKIVSKSTGDSLTASEFNQLPSEIQNAITSAGLTPTASSTTQLAQTISRFVGDANFYNTSGSANNIVLTSVSPRPSISTLTNGMLVRFQAIFNNTSSVTVNVNGSGAKNITLDGSLLTAGKIRQGKVYLLTYSSSTDTFDLFTAGYNTNNGRFSFFDLVTKDHILSYAEKEGLELLGSWVYRDEDTENQIYGYQTFYNTCVAEKNEATRQSITIAGSSVYVYKHANGHIYYDIADKSAFDALYASTGVAWYYGIDETNHRIFLPRNDSYFKFGSTADVGKYIAEGIPNIHAKAQFTQEWETWGVYAYQGAFELEARGGNGVGGSNGSFDIVDFNANRGATTQGIYRDDCDTVQPKSVSALCYMVVGETEESQLEKLEEYLEVLQLFMSIDAGFPSDDRVNYYDAGNITDNYEYLEYIDGGSPSDIYIAYDDIINLLNYPYYKNLIETLTSRVELLENVVELSAGEIEELQDTVAEMQDDIDTLTGDLSDLELEHSALSNRVESLETLIDAGLITDREE